MTETRYYHLTMKSLEQALPELLAKSLERNWKAVVMAGDKKRVETLNTHLWTYDNRTFLPHGSERDGEASYQPIWLTSKDENPNSASVLFLCDGMNSENIASYDLVCRLFDGHDEESVQKARTHWKFQKESGDQLTYWQQNKQGQWKKAAKANNSAE